MPPPQDPPVAMKSPYGEPHDYLLSLRRLVDDDDANGFHRQKGSVEMSPRHGPRRGWRLAGATAAAAVAAVGTLPSVASSATATPPAPDANPTACAHRVNNTPKKLVDCVTMR